MDPCHFLSSQPSYLVSYRQVGDPVSNTHGECHLKSVSQEYSLTPTGRLAHTTTSVHTHAHTFLMYQFLRKINVQLIPSPIVGTWKCYLHDKRDITDVTKLRLLRWRECYPELSMWVQVIGTMPGTHCLWCLKRETFRNAGYLCKPEKTRERIAPLSFQNGMKPY